MQKILTDIHRFRNAQKWDKLSIAEKSNRASLAPFDLHRCIYIHIPKTAGKSINKSLFKVETGYHKDIQYYIEHWSWLTYKWYFKFAFVRNPYERLVSTFSYYKGGGENDHDKAQSRQLFGDIYDVNEFIQEFLIHQPVDFLDTHFRTQRSFLVNAKNEMQMDFIGKFENIDSDFLKICKKLKLNNHRLKRINQSNQEVKSDLKLVLNKESIWKINTIYKTDFQTFGYQMKD